MVSLPVLLKALWFLAAAIFGAGVAWGAARSKDARMAKDLNAIGRKLDGAIAESERRDRNLERAVQATAPGGPVADRGALQAILKGR